MTFLSRSLVVLALTVILTGCFEKLYHPKIEVIEGTFVTPRGTFAIDTFSSINKGDFPWFRSAKAEYKEQIYLHGNDKSIYLSMGVLPQSRKISLIFDLDENGTELKLGDGFYFFNNDKTDLPLKKRDETYFLPEKSGPRFGQQFISYSFPKPLARLDTTIQGGSIKTPTINKIRKGENDVHRFLISFSLDDHDYVIDVSFHVKLGTEWTIGFAGTGP